ncbi:phytase [Xylariaceae sp. FL0594]|nr:phytase [Xylariaceae sp. FL0594]
MSFLLASVLLVIAQLFVGAVATSSLPIAARTGVVKSDFTATYYNGFGPTLIGNDGGAASGGFRTFVISRNNTVLETGHETPGRTKLVTTVYGVGGRDLIVTIAQPDSYFRLYDARTLEPISKPIVRALGDWSVLCVWQSPRSGNQYLYLFGKRTAVQFLLRQSHERVDILEIQTFGTPVEASSCAVSSAQTVLFSADDDTTIYKIEAVESTQTPPITVLGTADHDVTGLVVYVGKHSDYLLVAQSDRICFYDLTFRRLGSTILVGDDDIQVQGLSLYQRATINYPAGFLAYAIESNSGTGFGLSSLQKSFEEIGLEIHTKYDPGRKAREPETTVCSECNFNGYCEQRPHRSQAPSCSCFAGFAGKACQSYTCRNNCSGRGVCIGPNFCACEQSWGGLYCAFKLVKAVVETDANGGDGDDPAIWVSPVNKSASRIITTTKSDIGEGFAVFDLEGKKIQTIVAGKPNNVDVIYGFPAGNKSIDLIYAACRKDNTLCLFEMRPNGTLAPIQGGAQPTKDGYKVYGSCVYRSRLSGKQYLFVNAKTAEYLQFELWWNHDSQSLQTTLVRNLTGGSGGQVEGCVSDEANGWLIIGEEPRGLWRYGAEPDDDASEGFFISEVGDGHTYADIEGVTLVEGTTANAGFILVSQQGVSAYNVYRRQSPHEYMATFSIEENTEKGIDAVSNTDGIAAVGTSLCPAFPRGLLVVHDDVNQLPGGGTSDETSFKLVSLQDVLDDDLLAELDSDWNPRA